MKSLDEAIQHCLEVAEINRKEFGLCPLPSTECDGLSDCRCMKNGKEKGCLKCAEEHSQLAEWLRELKRARVLLKATHDLLMKTE